MATVRSGNSERLILCAFSDCDRYAQDYFQVRVPHGRVEVTSVPRTLTYLFCSERHRELYKHSHRDHGNLPSGSRGLLPPR